ncbi:uncharacterized [Tachysurus ichikawai]
MGDSSINFSMSTNKCISKNINTFWPVNSTRVNMAVKYYLIPLLAIGALEPWRLDVFQSSHTFPGGEEETTTTTEKTQEAARSGGAHERGEQMFSRCGLRLQEGPSSWLDYTLAALFASSSPTALILTQAILLSLYRCSLKSGRNSGSKELQSIFLLH